MSDLPPRYWLEKAGWDFCKSEDYCSSIADGTHDTPKPVAEGCPLYTSKNLTPSNRLDTSDVYNISQKDVMEINKRSYVGRYDILVGMIGTVGNPVIIENASLPFAVKNVGIFRFDGDYDRSSWFYYCLNSQFVQDQFAKALDGSTQKFVSLSMLRSFYIQVPQDKRISKTICDVLGSVDKLIEKTEALIAKYQAIKQGMMHDLFTRGVDEHGHLRPPYEEAPELYKQSELGWIPKEWEAGQLGDTCALLRDGTHLPPPRVENGPLLLSVQNVIDGKLTLTSSDTRVTEDFYKVMHKSWQIAVGDVLLAIVGATIGKVCEVPEGIETFSIQRSLCLFRGKQDVLRTRYLYYYMSTPVFQAALWNRVNQTAQPGVYLAELGQLRVPLPSFAEQEKIARRLSALTRRIEAEERAVDNLKSQKTGLMQDLLTGKVRVKVDEANEVAGV